MARIIFLISLTLLIGVALSLPSKSENSGSNEKKDKAASNEKSNEKQVESHKNHKAKNEKQASESKEKQEKNEDHKKNHSPEKNEHGSDGSHDKHKKHSKNNDNDSHDNDKHQKHNKHSSKSRKHHRKHSGRTHKKNETNTDSKNEIVESDDEGWEYENKTAVDTRRILYSKTTQKGKRPYMVYLQLTKESAKAHKYRGWLCGGVIVERYYVLTSAACVEDADHFYVVSGTTKFVDSFDYKDDKCVCNNRRKVVWKCIPKNYKFDFQDSIKWSSNDIAIVKVNKPFKFGVVEKGCEFAADLLCYNNVSRDLEKPGTKAWIAGWGSGSNFREGVYRRQPDSSPHIPDNAKCLQEAKVCIMDNEQCAKKWSQRFRSIITQYMICTKDVMKRLSEICDKRYANCTDVETRRSEKIDLGRHLRDPDDYTARRSNIQGGFCENDHGGPLIVKYQNKERVIGVISACKIDPKTHSCHGPFLYTSVFKNRQFISCSIYKDTEETCRRVFRTGITHEEWTVDWDGVKEDDDDRKDDSDRDGDDRNSDSNSASASKESLRQSKDEQKTSKAPATEATKSASSNSEESKKSKHTKSKEKSGEKSKHSPTKEKSAEKKGSSSEEKKQSKEASEEKKQIKEASEEKKQSKEETATAPVKDKLSSGSSSSSEEEKKVRRVNRDVFYESSRDDNVNEPGSRE